MNTRLVLGLAGVGALAAYVFWPQKKPDAASAASATVPSSNVPTTTTAPPPTTTTPPSTGEAPIVQRPGEKRSDYILRVMSVARAMNAPASKLGELQREYVSAIMDEAAHPPSAGAGLRFAPYGKG